MLCHLVTFLGTTPTDSRFRSPQCNLWGNPLILSEVWTSLLPDNTVVICCVLGVLEISGRARLPLLSGICNGVTGALAMGLPGALAMGLPGALAMGLPGALAMGLPGALAMGLPGALAMGLPRALAMGLPGALAMGLPGALAMGLPGALAMGLSYLCTESSICGKWYLYPLVIEYFGVKLWYFAFIYMRSKIKHPTKSLDVSLWGKKPTKKTTGGRLNKKDGLTRYGDSHVKDKTS